MLVAPARTSGTVAAVCTWFPVLAPAPGLAKMSLFACVVEDALRFVVKWMHLVRDSVLSLTMTGAADVEVFI